MLKHRNNTKSAWPWLTLSIGAIALLIHFFSSNSMEWIQYHRAAIETGAIWQLITGHFAHWNTEHLLADLAVFTVLGSMVETRSKKLLLLLVFGSALLISASVYFLRPTIEFYRGLSGIDMALAGFVFLDHCMQSKQKRNRFETIIWGTALLGVFLKPGIEIALGHPIFVQDLGKGIVGMPIPHILGAAFGITTILVAQKKSTATACCR